MGKKQVWNTKKILSREEYEKLLEAYEDNSLTLNMKELTFLPSHRRLINNDSGIVMFYEVSIRFEVDKTK